MSDYLVESAALQKPEEFTFLGLKALQRLGLFKQRFSLKQKSKVLKDVIVELEDLHLLEGENTYELHQLIQ